jgi:hypothetical protein
MAKDTEYFFMLFIGHLYFFQLICPIFIGVFFSFGVQFFEVIMCFLDINLCSDELLAKILSHSVKLSLHFGNCFLWAGCSGSCL